MKRSTSVRHPPRALFSPQNLAGLTLAAAAAFAPTPADAYVFAFQCQSSVCVLDPTVPNPPATPVPPGPAAGVRAAGGIQPNATTVLATVGTVAGITADGRTVAWEAFSPNRIVRSSVEGGPVTTLYTGEIYQDPRISSDGTKALWVFYLGGYGWFTYMAVNGTAQSIASSTMQTTHGWLGNTPIVARRGGGKALATICAEVAGGPACDTPLATDPSLQVSYPSGAASGTWIVAVRGQAASPGVPVKGSIALYSTATHTLVRVLTPGPNDTHPAISPDGNFVAFERDGAIWTIGNVLTTPSAPVRLTAGTFPFIGGPSGDACPPNPPFPCVGSGSSGP
ncbi:hypothetical protein [Inquilinus sp.]|uniref:hypothetical protein n=1 Tax=Inquilinus sp. TaxID=1932117 RepID=UPI0031E1A5AF